jgi:hypothetical protein
VFLPTRKITILEGGSKNIFGSKYDKKFKSSEYVFLWMLERTSENPDFLFEEESI